MSGIHAPCGKDCCRVKNPKTKIILTMLLTVLFIVVFIVLLVVQNSAVIKLSSPQNEALETEAINSTLEDIGLAWREAEGKVEQQYLISADISAVVVGSRMDGQADPGLKISAHNAVVTIQDDGLTAPGNIVRELGLEASLFTKENGVFAAPAKPTTLIVYSRIDSSACYVEWHENTVLADLIENLVNFRGIMLRSEAVCGGYALLLAEDPAAPGGFRAVYKNDLFAGSGDLDAMGLSLERIQQIDGKKDTLTLRDSTYLVSAHKVPELNGYLVMLTPKTDLLQKSLGQSTYTSAMVILLLFGIAVTGSSVSGYIQQNVLTPNMEQKYRPRNIRRLAMLYGVVGVLMIAISGLLDNSLTSLYDYSIRSRDVLQAVEKNVEMNAERQSRQSRNTENFYLYYGNRIADILNEQPELRDGDTLRSFAEYIGAASITLYDSRGRETSCSEDFVNLELGSDPASATYEFRRILKGIPSVFGEAKTDEETGLNEVRVGIRIDDPAEKGRYGVMIIALDPSVREYETSEEISTILGDMAISGTKLFIADRQTGCIQSSSDRDLIGKTIYDLGMGEGDLKDSLMKNLKTKSGNYYVASAVLSSPESETDEGADGSIVYYAENLDSPEYGISSVVASCIVFIVMYVILQRTALKGYTDEFYNENKHSGIRSIPGDSAPEDSADDVSGLKMIGRRLKAYWHTLSPGQRGMLTIEAILALLLIQQIPLSGAGNGYGRESLYRYISSGTWSRGINLFSLVAIANLAAEILLCMILVQLVLKGLSALSGPKGRTISRLISSLVRYLALFAFLIMAFSYLGVDRATIIACIGSLSLALSLGAQSLVNDILSGIAIIFEGTFQVGETVRISEWTGTVMEIGVSCTRILTKTGDIVTVSNRDIGQVVNLTQHDSAYTCEISLPSHMDIGGIERMLKEELPKIGEKDARFVKGPYYAGVTELSRGLMKLSIVAECAQEDYSYVRNKVNREVQSLFYSKGIKI